MDPVMNAHAAAQENLVPCPVCKINLVRPIPYNATISLKPACDPCRKKLDAQKIRDDPRKRLDARWLEFCPLIYRCTDFKHKSLLANSDAIAKVLAWEMNPKGLFIGGPSGRGKTRAVWALLKRLHYAGVKFAALNETEFSHQVGAAFATGAIEGKAFMDNLAEIGVLFLDDLGKSTTTSRFAQELYHVIEKRTSMGKPILASINATGKELEQHLGDVGSPVVRRLREFCTPIQFK